LQGSKYKGKADAKKTGILKRRRGDGDEGKGFGNGRRVGWVIGSEQGGMAKKGSEPAVFDKGDVTVGNTRDRGEDKTGVKRHKQ